MKEFDFKVCSYAFGQYLERMEFSFETKKGYEKDLKFFKRFVQKRKATDDFNIDNISKQDLFAFMDFCKKLGHKTNTIARRMATIKSFYKFLVMELDYSIDLAARIRLPKTYIPLRGILTEQEINNLLECSHNLGRFYNLLFSTLYYTGSRLTPIRTLKWENVFIEERMFYFPKIKGGKDLYVPMHEKLIAKYENYYENCSCHTYVFPSPKISVQPISSSDVRNKLNMAVQYANIKKKITPHSLRHTTATHLTLKGIDQRTIAAILGHTDLRSTMRYQHLSVEHLRDPIECL